MWLEAEHYITDKERNDNLGQQETYLKSNLLLNINYIEAFYESKLAFNGESIPIIICHTADTTYKLATSFETIKTIINGLPKMSNL